MTKRARRGAGGDGRPDDLILAALSHEFRTPLNGVLGMARLLAGTRLDAAQKSYVAALEESGEHLLGLVNQMLDMARIEATGLELHPAPMDIEHLLQGVAEIMSPRAHAKGLEIASACDPRLPRILADEARLRQVLFNLAGNAIKFAERGGVLISAEPAVGAGSAPGMARVRFAVRDTGPGVSADERQRIFEPFAQGRASAAESTGLGLAIVGLLAEAMDAELGIDSAPGRGSSFWLEAEFEIAPSAEADRPLGGEPVVIVSPTPILAEAAARQVLACGGEPLVFSSAKAAAEAPAGAPALVDFAVSGRRRPAPLAGRPSIVLLGPEMRARIPALRRAGFQGYLIKPLRRPSLATRLMAVLDQASSGPPSGAPPEDERARMAAGSGARVLLAEDNPINAMLATALLEREGCAVARARSGPEAVEAARGGAFDLILLDLRMPGMGGVEAARAMRAAGVSSPIAALTADAFEDSRRACLKAGMDDFLTKPLEPAALHALLGRVLRPGFTDRRAHAKLAS
jgi:CheY-like chemotaxis protein